MRCLCRNLFLTHATGSDREAPFGRAVPEPEGTGHCTGPPMFLGRPSTREKPLPSESGRIYNRTKRWVAGSRLRAFGLVRWHYHWPFLHPLPGFSGPLSPSPGVHDLALRSGYFGRHAS